MWEQNMSKSKPDITCIINAHGESHLITATLKSCMRARRYADKCGLQTRLVVVLDNSNDDTASVVEQFLDDSCLLEQVNFGDLAQARNYAATESESEYITFLDGDDLWCKTWLVDSYIAAKKYSGDVVLHPEYNVYFGSNSAHVLKHVDSESERFEPEHFFKQNYWTALTFAKRSIYLRFPYQKNTIIDGFGYEDWTWNYQTLLADIAHKTVRNNAHFIRRGKDEPSLLDMTNAGNAVPRILDIYRLKRSQHLSSVA